MSPLSAYAGRVAHVDLTTGAVTDYPWGDEERRLYLGGKTMAARIIADTLPADADPLGPANVIVVSTGPLTGTGAPSTSRFNVSARSPLTGLLGSSNCGGPFGIHLKRAGYDALVITGAAENPVFLEVAEDAISIRDAGEIWGLETTPAQEALAGAVEAARSGALAIGPAGENLVRYATLMSGERAAGRTGLGAVFGSKKLKGIVAHGSRKTEVAKPDEFRDYLKHWTKALKDHPLTGERLPQYGTAGLLSPMQKLGILATRNFSEGRFDDSDSLSGETLAATRLVGTMGCQSCPIKCGRVVELDDGRRIKGPELETLVLLGSNLGNADLGLIIEWNARLDELGIDTMSAGGSIGFAMELAENGLLGGVPHFGMTGDVSALIEDIAYRRGVGDALAEGTRRMSKRFGGAEYAMQVKGLELAAYEPRGAIGHALGYATSNRGGCHLNGGYLVVLEGLGLKMNGRTTLSKPQLAALFQDLMEATSASGGCLFTTYAVIPGVIVRHADDGLGRISAGVLGLTAWPLSAMRSLPRGLLGIPFPLVAHIKALELATGMKLGFGGFWEAGERGYTLERAINMRLGATAADDTLPHRATHEPGEHGTTVPLEQMRARYYRHRGWDEAGRPTPATLERLGLAGV